MIALSFIAFLSVFVIIGISSMRKSRNSREDYYLASSSIPPWLVGLSAMATNNSGYMFIGVIGYTYATGLAAIWLMVGWIAGDYLASLFVHRRLREATGVSKEASYAGVLSHWHSNFNGLQRVAGLISIVFLMAYASAQLVAGGKALHVLFDWPLWAGAVMGSILVMVYCFAGGIRASIWTDAAQSFVMVAAMAVLLMMGVQSLGGYSAVVNEMREVEGFLNLFPRDLALPGLAGGVLFALSWMFAGLSVIGQPHIMVRFMSLSDGGSMRRARAWYYLWFTGFYLLATGVGLLSRVYLSDPGSFDAELALPTMAMEILPPVLVGLVLAGIFAATLSTADSVILSCSAALTHDLLPGRVERTVLIKLATLGVTVIALAWALINQQSVFNLVIMAWSGMASSFAPLLLVLVLGGKPSQRLSIVMMLGGLITALVWRYYGYHAIVYEGMPGILAGLLIFLLGSRLRSPVQA
ncbi:MAG: sodium/proline symporter [Paracoccaceae bacterium]|jgi:sodium/proline symporter